MKTEDFILTKSSLQTIVGDEEIDLLNGYKKALENRLAGVKPHIRILFKMEIKRINEFITIHLKRNY